MTLVERVLKQQRQFNKDVRLIRLKQMQQLNQLLKLVREAGKIKP